MIADAVNLLSNDWNDTKTSSGTLPVAKATTYNMALITGNPETRRDELQRGPREPAALPRELERRQLQRSPARSSTPGRASTPRAPGSTAATVYTAPRRNWAYDTSFNLVANLPPFTPMAVSAEDVAVW